MKKGKNRGSSLFSSLPPMFFFRRSERKFHGRGRFGAIEAHRL